MTDPITPKDLSRELRIDANAIRTYLRSKYDLLPPNESRWNLSGSQAADVRANFNRTTSGR